MYPISRLPVVVLSSKRTGSTVLATEIRDQLRAVHGDVGFYNEPMESRSEDQMRRLMQAIDQKEPFVLKAHACDVEREYPSRIKDLITSGDAFVVRIRRRDIVEQIASHYLASKRNTWQYHGNEEIGEESMVPIDMGWLDRSIKYINHYNTALDGYPAPFDLDLCYEDLSFSGKIYVKTPKPRDYHALTEAVRDRLGLM